MDSVKNYKIQAIETKSSFKRLFVYLLFAILFLGPYIYTFEQEYKTMTEVNTCHNHISLCSPLIVNNIKVIFNYFNFSYLRFFQYFMPLFSIFAIFWLRIERFSDRQSFIKTMAYLLLLSNPFSFTLLTSPSDYSFFLLFFMLVSLGYETINHGMIIRGMIVSSSALALLSLSGGVGVVLGALLTSMFYLCVKWNMLKKYVLASFTLLLFPTASVLLGILYITSLYDANFSAAILNDNLQSLDLSSLLKWSLFLPLFLMYQYKDKKGLNIVKKYIVPVFFILELCLILLGIVHTQEYLLGMCIICVGFEIISDLKFSKIHILHILLFSILSWCSFVGLWF